MRQNTRGLVDLFCGAGGLSLGAHMAGFSTQLAVDIDRNLAATFSQNFPRSNLQLLDLAEVTGKSLRNLAGPTRPVGVVGGPPCQGFSEIGRRHGSDPRNRLVVTFMRLVGELNPQFFLMENVPTLLKRPHRELLDAALESLPSHYCVLDPVVLDAAQFGAATHRNGVVVMGFDPRSVDPLSWDTLGDAMRNAVSVREAIADLPRPNADTGTQPLPYPEREAHGTYATSMRKGPPTMLGNDWSRGLSASGQVTGLAATHHTPAVRRRFDRLAEGKRDPISRYPRLSWDSPGPVLRAGTGNDRGKYQAARPVHPSEPRVVSVREAARIQGFPDWFQFGETKWHAHRMIGNNVSPVFAQALLKPVQRALCD